MSRYIMELGHMGLIIIFILSIITIFALKNAYMLYIKKPKENLSKLGRSINTMLFWGAIIVILGFLGTFQGFQNVVEYMSQAGSSIDLPVFFEGVFLLLKLVIFSLTSFTIISIIWFIFTAKHRKLLERSMKESYTAE
ncbi:hypothetical protein ACFL6K_05695 [Candidatus Latescibacterota bacterium]